MKVRTLAATAAVAAVGSALVTAPALAGAGGASVARSAGELTRYHAALPAGATARVQSVATPAGSTVVTLTLKGGLPNTGYGAHAHTNACGPKGTDAGPHFQHVVDPGPTKPSTDPRYANPDNEIWLDLTTDASGTGTATTVVDWQFTPERRAHSVIIHLEHTHTGPTDSGFAGARVGCLTVGF